MLNIQTVFTKNENIADIDIKLFSNHRREKIMLCRNPEAKICSISASLALSRALSELGISEHDEEYGQNEFGKPYFKKHPELHFSLSHTDGLAIVAVSDTEVGVDCERKDRDVPLSVAKRFFSDKEVNEYKGSLISLWVAKEAYSKLLGKPFAECSKALEIPYFEKSLTLNGIEFQRLSVSGFEACVAKFQI